MIELANAWPRELRLGGFSPFSTVDWPGQLCAVVFIAGCPWRCAYCHNPDLQNSRSRADLEWTAVEARLARRQGLLDGVVFSGGEPTSDPALPQAIARMRALGFKVGLHTAGIYPERLAAVLPALDWVGFDLKSGVARYDTLTGAPGSARRAWASAEKLAASGVACEFRLTYHSALMDEADALEVAHHAADLGIRHFTLQAYRARPQIGQRLAPSAGIPFDLVERISPLFAHFSLRE
ncbi:anaerobic ribonucleoside-triphosphate reductase activating protein [Niveibacterium sp. SC-1]|uniref:anaerobic ribonucleoside-triphosphate reductase activating protein n=1 Tax=Niveibacterium sp. SC-1 TaxID=3135646 RepID=UPI00311F81A6